MPTMNNNQMFHTYKNNVNLYWNSNTLEYRIIRDNQIWFESGPFFIHFNQTFYSSAPEQEIISMSRLYLIQQYQTIGTDIVFGLFNKLSLRWSYTNTTNDFIWETSFKIFQEQSIILFEQYFPVDLNGMSQGNVRDTFKYVSTAFPRFKVSFNQTDQYLIDQLGHFTFLDAWDLNMRGIGLKNLFNGGLYSGNPLLLYNLTKLDSNIILSSLTNFMTNFQTRSPSLNYHLSCGLHGRIHQIQQSFSLTTILLGSQFKQGINQIINLWGKLMLQYYGKEHIKEQKNFYNDFYISKLGYYTDTGAYYWYNKESNLTYEQTFIKLKEYHLKQHIPIQYYELDSYWYYKQNNNTGEHGGIKLYEPRSDIFPNGIEILQREILQTPLIVHHKYYSTDNLYQNKYQFLNGSDGHVSLPLEQIFFNKIFSQIKQWGVEILIQDWLSSVYEDMPDSSYDIYTAREYHLHLAEGAKQAGIKLIYCMPLNPDIMETLENTQVHYMRISDDYSVNINQWNIGRVSMITWAIGVIPFKDTFWTTSIQPQSPYGNFTEPNVQLNALIALMSLGGVAISDKIGNTNLTVVNRLCRSDGVLFRPERPATAMDSTFLGNDGPKGEMWHSFSSDAEQNLFVEYVMITNLTESYTFSWNELFNTQEDDYPNRRISDIYIAFELENPRDYYWFTSTNSSTILMPSCAQDLITHHSPFHLFVFVPFSKLSNWILFGELNRQLPITRQRFVSIQNASDSLQINIIGVYGEQISITIGYSEHVLGKINIYTVQCSFLSVQGLSTMIITCKTEAGCQCNNV
ncbi:unnamed protein product [Rotaria sordida]|uniref:Uncharacterized protein n=1 Tax=Rotaria sordida TaxID=392033 RepID=A0A815VCB2_9BILA|nr:unnamed protein product [Rotaria sordida]CAF1530582.1 unnamed protein product [Rotaria sordida]